jgi:hypothetical protein
MDVLAASRDRLIVPEWTVKGNLWTATLEARMNGTPQN